jgi:hypothetical protein
MTAHDWGLVALAAAVFAVGWGYSLLVHPRAQCFGCRGRRGRNAGSSDRVWGRCPVCKGTGERWRVGARAVAGLFGRKL